MKIVKRILQGIGIIIGMVILYLSVITFAPGFEVPAQPLKKAEQPLKKKNAEPPRFRKNVSFNVSGTSISAWLYLPENLSAAVPGIVMGHGFGGTKDMLLEHYAIPYQAAGFAVLVFDYRHFGESAGEPRQLLSIPRQLEDWAAAINYAREQKEINPAKIALWGTSMSGGHVIISAAREQRTACVIAQCPGLDSHASGKMLLKKAGIGYLLQMLMHGQRDYFRSWFGLSPHKVPIMGKPGSIAFLTTPDAYSGYSKLISDNFINEVCARIFLQADEYRPITHAKNVRCPVLLQVCEYDSIIPKSAAEAAEKQLGKYAEAIYYPIGHFDIYDGANFDKAINDQLNFLKKHLSY